MPDLRDADVNTLVLESGRRIESLAKAIVTDETDAYGKPLMLGERMRLLADRLEPETRRAYREWSRARNAYVHAEHDAIPDQAGFYEQYREVAEALAQLGPGAQEYVGASDRPASRELVTPLNPAEAAALANAGEPKMSTKPKASTKPKRKRSARKKSGAPEAVEPPSVVGPVTTAALIVGLALAYYSC